MPFRRWLKESIKEAELYTCTMKQYGEHQI